MNLELKLEKNLLETRGNVRILTEQLSTIRLPPNYQTGKKVTRGLQKLLNSLCVYVCDMGETLSKTSFKIYEKINCGDQG